MRKRALATIRRVNEVKPIKNADKIEIARIDGWQCVIKKDEFKVGDLGVYFEIDSFLPVEERYEFLRKSSYKVDHAGNEGFRLRTVKLRGELSQGLLLPLDVFPEISNPIKGQDVSELLNVILYEPPIPVELSGKVKGSFPLGISKSDQERIQNLPEYLEKYNDMDFEVTEKLDGTSCTIYYHEDDFGICSRNWELAESETNLFWRISNLLNLKQVLSQIGKNIAIQGELIGEKIQNNPYMLKGQSLMVYNIWDIEKREFLNPIERVSLYKSMEKLVNNDKFGHVPILHESLKIIEIHDDIDQLLEFSRGKSKLNKNVEREGIVCKSNSSDISFKIINNKYLLKSK